MSLPVRNFTMNFYCYRGDWPLGKEPLGTSDKLIWRDLTTVRGAILRANRHFGHGNYCLYTFSNFYDDRTFEQIMWAHNHGGPRRR